MSLRVSPALQRVAAVAILVITAAAVIFGGIQPLVAAYTDTRATIDRQRAAIDRAKATGLDPAVLQAELSRLKQRQGAAAGLIESPNESLAAAELRERLKSTVETARGELRSTQTLPSRAEGRFRRVTIRAQAAVKIVALQRVLHDLESSSPLLFLDNFEIRARPDQSGRAGATEDPNLDVRFDLFGYMRTAP